jgi:tetratricopeptide (TPR) repeat protein
VTSPSELAGRARAPRGPRGLRLESLALLGLVSLVAVSAIACSSLRRVHVRPVSAEASRAFAEARAAVDGRGEETGGRQEADAARARRDRARVLAREALEVEPGWVGPARLLDDLDREELRGVEALAARREALARDGESAGALYLAGRLEGEDGEPRFERALDLDPADAWARHGLAWSAQRRNDLRAAIGHERAAIHRARDPWERIYFTSALARFLAQADRPDEAVAAIGERLAERDSTAGDRLGLEVEGLGIAMERIGSEESEKAMRRALDLLREEDLSGMEVQTLVSKLQFATILDKSAKLELSTALAARRSPARDRLRAELMLAAGPTPLALGLLERAREDEGAPRRAGPLMRAARFSAGEPVQAIEIWLEDLPAGLRGEDGLPRDPRLARIVRCARGLPGPAPSVAGAEAWFDLADALIAAGWFREARALAGDLAHADLDRALTVETRAVSGLQILEGLDAMIADADAQGLPRPASVQADGEEGLSGEARVRESRGAGPRRSARDLTGLLGEMGSLLSRSSRVWDASIDAEELGRSLVSSPVLEYGPAGEVVHPGPVFSAADERQGLGRAGAPVPGLARAMDALGRFALVGELAGSGGPDGTILSRILVEPKSGEHLGVPWSGTVAWCEGTDVRSRMERLGARVSAAALHEGYWLDVQSVRGELGTYRALAAEFEGEGAAARLATVLGTSGLPLESKHEENRRAERRRMGMGLGEANRVRLAILRDAAPGEGGTPLGEMKLERLVVATATHEEGHLIDRTRFLPISQHWGEALAFLFDCGFSPTRVAERLEYRAQLVALCDAPDPRIVLAQTLDAVDSDARGPTTAHAAGYADLLEDLLIVLDERLAAKGEDYPELDPSRTLVHQLHRLPGSTVREIARRLAKQKGMVR